MLTWVTYINMKWVLFLVNITIISVDSNYIVNITNQIKIKSKIINDDNYIFGDQNVQVPAHLNFGKFLLDRIRQKNNEVALENGETRETLSYKEFTQYAVNLGAALMKLGVETGDTVALGSEKRNEFVPTILAIVFTGATYTPYDLRIDRGDLKYKINLSQPTYFICSNLFWNTYSDIIKSFDCIKHILTLDDATESVVSIKNLASTNVDVNRFEPATVQGQTDTAVILYSSGTTGMPKGVQLTHLNCILNSLPDDDDTLKTAFLAGDWYHNYDTFITFKFLSAGRKIVYVKVPKPQNFLKSVEDCHVNIAFLVPHFISYLSTAKEIDNYNLESLNIIYSRSSPLHSKTIFTIQESADRDTSFIPKLKTMKIKGVLKPRLPFLKSVIQGYGMTEAGEPTSETWGTKGFKAGSVGMVSPSFTLKVVDTETRKTLGPEQRGEICLRGPALMKGYIGVDPSTYMDEEGFYKTGDFGFYDNDRYFYIVDRLKDIIVYDGHKVAPLQLEAILQLHPGVHIAGVVGKPVSDFGEEPTAFVVKQIGSDVTEKDLIEFVALKVPPFMQLKGGVKFIQEIPRNLSGKILRRGLREMLK